MSYTKPTEVEKMQLRLTCPKCKALPQNWCLQGPWRDVRAKTLHAVRSNEAVKLRRLPLRGQDILDPTPAPPQPPEKAGRPIIIQDVND